MSEPRKDGCDENGLWPTVRADDWQEAVKLGGEQITYECADGHSITFGKRFKLRRDSDGSGEAGQTT